MMIQDEFRVTGFKPRRWVVFLWMFLALSILCVAQDATTRKVKTRALPLYPELAQKMRLVATVKVQVTVAPNGAVLQAKALGGHPLLVDASVEAARHYRYEPGADTTTNIIEFHFAPGVD